jgi:hypothetical protein
MDAQHFREKAEVLLQLADALSLNNFGRFQLMELAEDLMKRARELEAQATLQPQQSELEIVNSEPDTEHAARSDFSLPL